MNTNMTGFRLVSKSFATLSVGQKYPQHWKIKLNFDYIPMICVLYISAVTVSGPHVGAGAHVGEPYG